MKLFTIGVYGSTEESFFRALNTAGIDALVDIRQRRGMRGSTYSYVNSTALQSRLRQQGIRYIHLRELAPSLASRQLQHASDNVAKITKRERSTLSTAFVEAYKAESLAPPHDPEWFLKQLAGVSSAVLFCVERLPEACHRLIVAEAVAPYLGEPVTHLLP